MAARDGFASHDGAWPTASARDGDPKRGATRADSAAWQAKKARGAVNAAGLPSDDLSSAASMWMTPNVPNGGRCLSKELVESKGMTITGEKRTVGLESQTRHWATPDCNTSSYSNGKFGMNLREQAATWPTPDVCSQSWDLSKIDPDRQRRPDQKVTIGIAAAAENWPSHWPTPATRDYRTPNSPNSPNSQATRNHSGGEQLPNYVEHHFSHPVLSTLDGRQLSPTDRTLPRRLNPAFACWLMGWPIWWTNPALTSCARSVMASYRCRLRWHLSSLCGEHGGAE